LSDRQEKLCFDRGGRGLWGEVLFGVREARCSRDEGGFFIADGANWVRSLKNNYFPEAIGVFIRYLAFREGAEEGFGRGERSGG
jgi:hypothetical protein